MLFLYYQMLRESGSLRDWTVRRKRITADDAAVLKPPLMRRSGSTQSGIGRLLAIDT